jgi:hypothetical protein
MSQLEREMAAKEGRVLGMRAELESLESFIGQWKAGAEDSPQPDDYLMQMVPRPTTHHDPLPTTPTTSCIWFYLMVSLQHQLL